MNAVATVTSRGQVTLPRIVREALRSRFVEFEVRNDVVLVRSVQSVGGSLAAYAGRRRPFAAVRDQAWREVSRAKAQSCPA